MEDLFLRHYDFVLLFINKTNNKNKESEEITYYIYTVRASQLALRCPLCDIVWL